MAKKSVYSNQPGAKNTPASGKPHPSPSNVVTGAGPKGNANWKAMYSGKGSKGC